MERVEKLATALHDRGLRKGDVVCLYADKSIVGVITVYAIVSMGAVLTPCRPSHTAGMYISGPHNIMYNGLTFCIWINGKFSPFSDTCCEIFLDILHSPSIESDIYSFQKYVPLKKVSSTYIYLFLKSD